MLEPILAFYLFCAHRDGALGAYTWLRVNRCLRTHPLDWDILAIKSFGSLGQHRRRSYQVTGRMNSLSNATTWWDELGILLLLWYIFFTSLTPMLLEEMPIHIHLCLFFILPFDFHFLIDFLFHLRSLPFTSLLHGFLSHSSVGSPGLIVTGTFVSLSSHRLSFSMATLGSTYQTAPELRLNGQPPNTKRRKDREKRN